MIRKVSVRSITIPFGLKDGRLVSVAQAERGKACGCICPACKLELLAIKGVGGPRSPRPHFKHLHQNNCESGLETGLHILAKEILDQGRLLHLPDMFAEHAGKKELVRRGWDATYHPRIVEPTTTELGSRNVRPDLIVDVEFHGRQLLHLPLFIEIFVRHKTEQKKIQELKEQGIAAIEIDLSQIPDDETREFYEDAILRTSERHWLHSRLAEDKRREMRAKAEEQYGHIGDKIRNSLADPQSSPQNPWIQPVADAGLAELTGLTLDGHECFRTTSDIWQAAILCRHVVFAPKIFEPLDTLRWLSDEDLLKAPFKRLLNPEEGCLAHVKDYLSSNVPKFHLPVDVILDFAGEMCIRGKLEKCPGDGRRLRAPEDIAHEAKRRADQQFFWRMREAELREPFESIKIKAERRHFMDWNEWIFLPLSAYGGKAPKDLITAPEDQFQALVKHLRALRGMLDKGGNIPDAGLLNLPIEKERNDRQAEVTERMSAQSRREAERREAERREAEPKASERTEAQRATGARQSTTIGGQKSGTAQQQSRRRKSLRDRVQESWSMLRQLFNRRW